MNGRDFIGKICSKRLWLNILGMLLVVVALIVGVYIAIGIYTHHGEEIEIPDIRHMQFFDAEHILDAAGLTIQVSDTGYVRTLPADCILEQSPVPGRKVKEGRTVYVVINSSSSPMLTIPDIIDNCSYREARAKLTAMGFKVGPTEYIPGEKDWLYGLKHKGVLLHSGSKVSVDDVIVMQVGDGLRDENDSIVYLDGGVGVDNDDFTPVSPDEGDGGDDEDDFEVVTGP
ncbi:MAG: PASTA domain-containing protein [Prevotella sp.]|nr:PASTA domain-containing protein [Prevotella sp.]